MIRRPPRTTRTYTRFPYTTLFRSLPFEQIVRDAMAERIARKVNLDLTTGDGPGDPNGIVTASTLGKTTAAVAAFTFDELMDLRSEEHTSELQSLMRISYAVICLKKKTNPITNTNLIRHNIPT